MVGRENCARIGQWNLETRFNAAFADKLLVITDEVVNKENVFDTASPLKQLITDETVRSEEKFCPNLEVTNRMSWIFTSNANVPVRIEGEDDRRYSVFRNMNVPPVEHRRMLSGFYGKEGLSDEFLQTEVAAFMWELVNLKVDEELIRRPYENEARRTIAKAGENSVEAFGAFLKEVGLESAASDLRGLREDAPDMKPGLIVQDILWLKMGRCRCDGLYQLYRLFCTRGGYTPFNQSKFPGELMKVFPGLKKVRAIGEKRDSSAWQQEKVARPWIYDGLPQSTVEEVKTVEPIATPAATQQNEQQTTEDTTKKVRKAGLRRRRTETVGEFKERIADEKEAFWRMGIGTRTEKSEVAPPLPAPNDPAPVETKSEASVPPAPTVATASDASVDEAFEREMLKE